MTGLTTPEGKGMLRTEAVSRTFNMLVNSFTQKHPGKMGSETGDLTPENALEEEQKEQIKWLIGNTNPRELAKLILKQPPTVIGTFKNYSAAQEYVEKKQVLKPTIKITEPGEEDVDFAENTISSITVDTIPQSFEESLIVVCKKFLKAPIISDGFTNHHEQRTPWQKGIIQVLGMVKQIDKSKHDWDLEFSRMWNNNRFNGTARNKIIDALNANISPKNPNLSATTIERLKIYLKEVEEINNTFENKTTDEVSMTEAANSIAKKCQQIIALFTKPSKQSSY